MNFINVKTSNKQSELNVIMSNLTDGEIYKIEKILSRFEFVEYTNEMGYECMFAIVDKIGIEQINIIYTKYGLTFTIEDLTKEVLFDIKFKTRYKDQYLKNVQSKIIKLINKFKSEFTTADVVLDKILEKGIESLTDFDKSILENL